MPKIRLTKNELKKQKDALKRYNQYLPTLVLKKQQLQVEMARTRRKLEDLKKEKAHEKAQIYQWVDVFAEEVGVEKLIALKEIVTEPGNIAGIDIPIFEKAVFEEKEYDLEKTPLWVDAGLEALKTIITINTKMKILQEQERLVAEELRVTTQRVNLFEKVMIPRAKENIRKIQIYLGDLQTASVVTGKIAKEKILRAANKSEV